MRLKARRPSKNELVSQQDTRSLEVAVCIYYILFFKSIFLIFYFNFFVEKFIQGHLI